MNVRPGARAASRLLADPGAVVGGALLTLLLVAALAADRFAPFDPLRQYPDLALQPPSLTHPFGTDQFGRDVLSRVIFGARLSLALGVGAVALAVLPGVSLGLLAGFFAGWPRAAIMRLTDVLMAFPNLLLALAIAAMLGRDPKNVVFAVAVALLPQYIRVVQGATLVGVGLPYVEAARALGAGAGHILVRHLLPGVLGPVTALATLSLAQAILAAATLNFLGLGPPPPTPEWGLMLTEGRDYLHDAWWISTFPGLAITVTMLAVNLVGDAVRDALDPRLAPVSADRWSVVSEPPPDHRAVAVSQRESRVPHFSHDQRNTTPVTSYRPRATARLLQLRAGEAQRREGDA